MTEHEISSEPPRDDGGHPVHPEKGYPICAAQKSDRTTPTEHGRERDDYEYCLQRAGWGTDRDIGPCRNHPISGEQWGKSNPNFKTGATSEYFKSKLSDRQRDVYDEMVDALEDTEESEQLLNHIVSRIFAAGEHTQDASLLREARQWASEFGVLETAPEKREIEHSGTVDTELSVPDHVAEAIATNAESNLEEGDDS